MSRRAASPGASNLPSRRGGYPLSSGERAGVRGNGPTFASRPQPSPRTVERKKSPGKAGGFPGRMLLKSSSGLLCALLLGCAATAPHKTVPTGATNGRPPCCRELKPGVVFTDRSLYQLDSEWTSDVGRKIKLGVFTGRPQVVALFFTHCEYACPIIVNDLKRIEAALTEKLRGQVDFLLISLDPERDTPAVLHGYRKSRQLSIAHWSLLQGGGEDVRELAALLGVNYRKDARGQYAHSNVITLLNAKGEIVHQLTGLNQDVTSFVQIIGKTLSD